MIGVVSGDSVITFINSALFAPPFTHTSICVKITPGATSNNVLMLQTEVPFEVAPTGRKGTPYLCNIILRMMYYCALHARVPSLLALDIVQLQRSPSSPHLRFEITPPSNKVPITDVQVKAGSRPVFNARVSR